MQIWDDFGDSTDARKTFTRYEIGLHILWSTSVFQLVLLCAGNRLRHTSPAHHFIPACARTYFGGKDTSSHWSNWNGYLELIWIHYFWYRFRFNHFPCVGITNHTLCVLATMIAEPQRRRSTAHFKATLIHRKAQKQTSTAAQLRMLTDELCTLNRLFDCVGEMFGFWHVIPGDFCVFGSFDLGTQL